MGNRIAEDIEPLEIQKWLNALPSKEQYEWTTVSKIRGIMNRIFKIGIIHKKLAENPVNGLKTSTRTSYKAIKITPVQTLSILRSTMQNVLYFTLVFVVAATALRSSEVLALRWADIPWEERKIRIVKSWKKTGVDGDPKTASSVRDAPMGRVLAHYLRESHKETPYAKPARLRVRLAKKEWQSSDLGFSILPRPLASSGEEGWRCDPRRASLGFAQPPAQLVELAAEQGEGEPEDGAGHLGSFAYPDHA